MYRELSRRVRRRGLTIMEVVVASALLIAAIVPILKALTLAHVSTNAIERKTYSLLLAQGKMEEIRARSIYHYGDSFAESDTVLSGAYLCDVTDDADPNLRTVAVSVGEDRDGDSSLEPGEVEVTLSSYVARRW